MRVNIKVKIKANCIVFMVFDVDMKENAQLHYNKCDSFIRTEKRIRIHITWVFFLFFDPHRHNTEYTSQNIIYELNIFSFFFSFSLCDCFVAKIRPLRKRYVSSFFCVIFRWNNYAPNWYSTALSARLNLSSSHLYVFRCAVNKIDRAFEIRTVIIQRVPVWQAILLSW